MEELWKPINGYEEFFEVSNLGRIKALRRTHKRKGRGEWVTEEIIRNQKLNKDGYNAFTDDWVYDSNGELKEFSYEEAELACLDKLIEIVESKQKEDGK